MLELPHVADNLTQRAAALQKLGDERIEGVGVRDGSFMHPRALSRAGITPPPRAGHIDDAIWATPPPARSRDDLKTVGCGQSDHARAAASRQHAHESAKDPGRAPARSARAGSPGGSSAELPRRLRPSQIPFIQRKLVVGTVDDPLEAAADRAAERVLGMPAAAGVADGGTAAGQLFRWRHAPTAQPRSSSRGPPSR